MWIHIGSQNSRSQPKATYQKHVFSDVCAPWYTVEMWFYPEESCWPLPSVQMHLTTRRKRHLVWSQTTKQCKMTAWRRHTCQFDFGEPGVDTWQVSHIQFKLLPLSVQTCVFGLICLHLDMRSLFWGRHRAGEATVLNCHILWNKLHVGQFRRFRSCRFWTNGIKSWYSLHLLFNAVISLIHNIEDLGLFGYGTLMKLTAILWHILQKKEAGCLQRGLKHTHP